MTLYEMARHKKALAQKNSEITRRRSLARHSYQNATTGR